MSKISQWPFNQDTANTICDLVAEGQNLHRIGKLDGFPPRWRIDEWLEENEGFAAKYARAREARSDWRAARIDEITSRLLEGEIDPGAARVAIDAEKWQAGKEKPKVYGDKIVQEQTGPNGGPLQTEVAFKGLTLDELKNLAKLGSVE